MLKSSVKCRYILQVQIEIDDIANIFSRLDCEYERFGEIYPMMVTDNTFRVQLEKIWHNLCVVGRNGTFSDAYNGTFMKVATCRITEPLSDFVESLALDRGLGSSASL